MRRCEKCGYESEDNKEIKLDDKEIFLCSICSKFSPDNEHLKSYLQEKTDWKALESFRKFYKNGNRNVIGMGEKAKQGQIVSRAAFGYKLVNKDLLPDEDRTCPIEKTCL